MGSKGNSDMWCLDFEQAPVRLLDSCRIAKLTEGLDRRCLAEQIMRDFCLASGRPDGCRYVFDIRPDGMVEILDFDGARLDFEELPYEDDLAAFLVAVYTATRTLSQDEEPLTLRNPFSGFKCDDYRVGLQKLIDSVKTSVPVIILND